MSGIEKYIRELHQMGVEIRNLINAASIDLSLEQPDREDLVWELTRLSAQLCDTVAALLMLGRNSNDL